MKLLKIISLQFAIVLVFLVICGCGTTVDKRQLNFEQNKSNNIKRGMTTLEIKNLFGEPDFMYETAYGENTGKEWNALIWQYYTIKDPGLKYISRKLTNTFVFWNDSNPPKLNYWNFEYTYKNGN